MSGSFEDYLSWERRVREVWSLSQSSQLGNDHVIMTTLNVPPPSLPEESEVPPLARASAAASCGHVVVTVLVFAAYLIHGRSAACDTHVPCSFWLGRCGGVALS